ncbi:unnamed protein product [Vitrella brassicaformis CCMP3155]|uniref:Uncharacterized protein n=1 Tax=Vitrella brassicaformis (strain CCMP3155) TaxID=1169540 RepID=A0A0G4FVN4_VITBC|nr:unnamed protein product [Vitrella brassicaformis CCMP3155]|eukprot:CEM18614.1 unnamed protein product [Vitrella brassicaformis CCMP3155]
MQPPQQQQQQPFSYIFVGRRTFYLFSSIKDVAGLRWAVNGQQVQLLRFADDQFGAHDLLAAVCVVEEGNWGEMGEVIELAGQCGNRELPVTLSAADINAHANKTAYVSVPRVLAQLKMVGRHVHFSDNHSLQLFHHGNGQVRAIIDEPGFRLQVDPPLPAGHLYQRHRQPHDPPVLSSFAKFMVIDYLRETHQINHTGIRLNRGVGGGRVNELLTESPHTPVAGCTTTMSLKGRERRLVLTDSSHPFVAWIDIWDRGNTGPVRRLCVRVVCSNTASRSPLSWLAWYWGRWDHSYSTDKYNSNRSSSNDADDGSGDEIGDRVDDGSGEGDGGEGGAAEAEGGG